LWLHSLFVFMRSTEWRSCIGYLVDATWLERGGDGEWWGGHAGGFCTYLVAHPRSALLHCTLVFWLAGTAADNKPLWLVVMHSPGS